MENSKESSSINNDNLKIHHKEKEVTNLAQNVNNLNISSSNEMQKLQTQKEPTNEDKDFGRMALRNYLQVYDSSDSESEPDDQIEINDKSKILTNIDSSSSSEEDENNSEDSSEDSDDDKDVIAVEKHTGAVRKSKDTHKKSNAEELPPVPDISGLNINADNLEFINIGKIVNVIDTLVTVETKPNLPAYDIDTILFLDNKGTPLGFIDDVIGTVSSPIYVVRFNTVKQIESMNIKTGQDVYSAPKSTHTKYVFLQQLLKLKGTDASWVGDNEVPVEFQDFSDDEIESGFKHGKQSCIGKKRPHSSTERHKRFERTMNIENRIDTCLHKAQDTFTRHFPSITTPNSALMSHVPGPTPAPFNPFVPPPSLVSARPTVIVAPTVNHSYNLPNMMATAPPGAFPNYTNPPPNLNAPPPVIQNLPPASQHPPQLPFAPRFASPYTYNAPCARPFLPRNGKEGTTRMGLTASQMYWQTEGYYGHPSHGAQQYPFRYASPNVPTPMPPQLGASPLESAYYGPVIHPNMSSLCTQNNSPTPSQSGISKVNDSRQRIHCPVVGTQVRYDMNQTSKANSESTNSPSTS